MDLLKLVCDLGIQKWNPAAKQQPQTATSKKIRVKPKQNSRYISVNTKCDVWRRDEGKCKLCGSNYALQLDHIVPFSFGGQSELTNLRLLCRNCNQRAAIEKLGLLKMDRYLR